MAYHLIQKPEDLKKFVDRILERRPIIGVDTETQGLRPEIGHRIIGPSVSLGSDREHDDHFYVPIRHQNYDNCPLDAYRNEFGRLLADPELSKVFFNLKFDQKMFQMDRIKIVGPVHDGMLLAYILQEDKKRLGLKFLAEQVLGEKPDDQQALKLHLYAKFPNMTKEKEFMEKLEFADPNVVCQYACSDTRLTLALFEHYMKVLNKKGTEKENKAAKKLYTNYEKEIEVAIGLVDTELRGVPVDLDLLKKEAAVIKKKFEKIHLELCQETGLPKFNPKSGTQVHSLLFDILGLPLPKAERSATGKVSLDDKALKHIDHPIAQKIREFRKASDAYSKYWFGMQKWVTENGLIHPNLKATGTVSARFSSSDPNLQNQPPTMRPVFLVRPNYKSLRWDYSQIEMRIFAHYSKDKVLVDGYNNDIKFDIHQAVADELSVPRKKAKPVNFCVVYGGSAPRLSVELGITRLAAKTFLNNYYARFPGVMRLRKGAQRAIENRAMSGNVTLPFKVAGEEKMVKWGSITDEFGRVYWLPYPASYRAGNRLIQGCAANLMKWGMSRVYAIIEEMRRKYDHDVATLLMNIHDEIEVEMRKDISDEAYWVDRISKALVDFPQFRVPIRADLTVSETSWADVKPYETAA